MKYGKDKGAMSNKPNVIKGIAGVFIGLLVILGVFYLFADRGAQEAPSVFNSRVPKEEGDQADRSGVQNAAKDVIYLYFANKGNTHLISEERVVPFPDNPVELGRIVVRELIKGPEKELMRTIPEHTALNALYIAENGTAYVDLSERIKEDHPGGVQMELMTIYSIVNSLVLNIPEIRTVKILIQGRESMTLAGHIDLRVPFKANMMLVR